MEDRRNYNERWHISKGIDIGHMVATLSIVITLVVGWSNTQDQINSNTLNVAHNKELILMQKELVESMGTDTNERLVRMDGKLDRLIERTHNGTK